MDSRSIAPSFLHREIDEKKEQHRKSLLLHLREFKARRKRLSTCESNNSTTKLVDVEDPTKKLVKTITVCDVNMEIPISNKVAEDLKPKVKKKTPMENKTKVFIISGFFQSKGVFV